MTRTKTTGDPGRAAAFHIGGHSFEGAEMGASGRERSVSGLYKGYVVGLLAVALSISYMDRAALAVLAPLIQRDLGISDGELGLLIGFAFALFYALFGFPIARLADRTNRRNILGISLILWSSMTALTGLAHNFAVLAISRIGIGAGEAGCVPTSNSLLCDIIAPQHRPLAFSFVQAGAPLGAFLGFVVIGWLGSSFGWRTAFLLLGIPGVLLGFVVFATVREPVRGRFDVAATATDVTETWWRALATLARIKVYRLMVAFTCCVGLTSFGLISWWPTFFQRILGIPLSEMSLILGFTLPPVQIAGLLAGGWIAAKAPAGSTKTRPLLLSAAGALLSVPMILIAVYSRDVVTVTALVCAYSFLSILPIGIIATALAESVPPHLRATGSATQIFLTSVIGFGGGPTLIGLLSDSVGLRHAMAVPAIFYPVIAFLLWRIAKNIDQSSDRVS